MTALDLFDISGKRAVVTGGGSGIGTMIASGFIDAGVSVIIASRKEESLKQVADELSERGDCSYVVADLVEGGRLPIARRGGGRAVGQPRHPREQRRRQLGRAARPSRTPSRGTACST